MKLFEKLRWLPTEMPDARDRRRLGEELRAADVGRRDAGNEQRQVEEVAAVQRQALDFGLRDRAGDLAARRLEHGRLAGDGDARVHAADRERDRQLERRADGERQQRASRPRIPAGAR